MNLRKEYTLAEKPALDYLQPLMYSYIDRRKLAQKNNNELYSLREVILPTRMRVSQEILSPDIRGD